MAQNWVNRWRRLMRKTKLPGVWELQSGGYYVRAKWKTNGDERRELQKALPHAISADDARRQLLELMDQAKSDRTLEEGTKPLFSEYAASVLESRIRSKRIKSPASVVKWQNTLELHLLPVFGHRPIDEIGHRDILYWVEILERKIHSNEYGARTVNTWIRIVKSIFKVGAPYFGFPNPAQGIMQFPEVERTYTAEAPNALPPRVVALFMAHLRKKYPQHFAMAALMLAAGLRPSSLRPLRRRGLGKDYCQATGRLEIRRSQVIGEPMDFTKTNRDQTIYLPTALREILDQHVADLDADDGPMGESDLLFPGDHGGYRSRSVLDDPLRDIANKVGLPFRITAKAFRRSFKNFTRGSKVDRVLERSVSGHHTEEMDQVYGFAFEDEHRALLGARLAQAGILQKGVIPGCDRETGDCRGQPPVTHGCSSGPPSALRNSSK